MLKQNNNKEQHISSVHFSFYTGGQWASPRYLQDRGPTASLLVMPAHQLPVLCAVLVFCGASVHQIQCWYQAEGQLYLSGQQVCLNSVVSSYSLHVHIQSSHSFSLPCSISICSSGRIWATVPEHVHYFSGKIFLNVLWPEISESVFSFS